MIHLDASMIQLDISIIHLGFKSIEIKNLALHIRIPRSTFLYVQYNMKSQSSIFFNRHFQRFTKLQHMWHPYDHSCDGVTWLNNVNGETLVYKPLNCIEWFSSSTDNILHSGNLTWHTHGYSCASGIVIQSRPILENLISYCIVLTAASNIIAQRDTRSCIKSIMPSLLTLNLGTWNDIA